MENTKIKILTKIIVRFWLIMGNLIIIFFIFAPKDFLDISWSGTIACYGIISFFVNQMDKKYCPERTVSKISKVISILMILLMIMKGFCL